MDDRLSIEQRDGYIKMTIHNSQKKNALDREMIFEMTKFFNAHRDSKICVLLTGEGDYFSSGIDLRYMLQCGDMSIEDNITEAYYLWDMYDTMSRFTGILCIFLNGPVLGGSAGIIGAGDLILATPGVTIRFPEITVGLAPALVSSYFLRTMPLHPAKFYFYSGEPMNAQKAYEFGIIHKIVKDEEEALSFFNTVRASDIDTLVRFKELLMTYPSLDGNEYKKKAIGLLAYLRNREGTKEKLNKLLQK